VTVNSLVDDMLYVMKFISGRGGERWCCTSLCGQVVVMPIVAAVRNKLVDLIIKYSLIVQSQIDNVLRFGRDVYVSVRTR
jgi:predicted Co/Zn/Cd cation transporter (cation efflux family)